MSDTLSCPNASFAFNPCSSRPCSFPQQLSQPSPCLPRDRCTTQQKNRTKSRMAYQHSFIVPFIVSSPALALQGILIFLCSNSIPFLLPPQTARTAQNHTQLDPGVTHQPSLLVPIPVIHLCLTFHGLFPLLRSDPSSFPLQVQVCMTCVLYALGHRLGITPKDLDTKKESCQKLKISDCTQIRERSKNDASRSVLNIFAWYQIHGHTAKEEIHRPSQIHAFKRTDMMKIQSEQQAYVCAHVFADVPVLLPLNQSTFRAPHDKPQEELPS